MRKVVIKILGVILIGIFLFQSNIVLATTQGDLNNANKKIEEAKEELNEIKTEKSEVLQQVEKITGEISEYQRQIDSLTAQISELNVKIEEEEDNLKKAQDDYDKQQELLEARLVATYEAGETSYLDFLLSSETITDLISNYYLVTELANNDAELLDGIQKQKEEIQKAKETLENSKRELDTSKASKQQVATQLSQSKQEKDKYAAQLTESEKQTQAELDQYEADKREIQAELAAIARREAEARRKAAEEAAASGGSSKIVPETITPSASGYIFPVSGLSKANISNKSFPSYPGHTGVDVNINVSGRTIVAVKAGTVERSRAYIRNGRYYSYGECIVINHHDGTATLYAHGAPGSRRVSEGQTVSQGQGIMTVGTTGNSTGEHLHFEVLKGGIPVNPLPYLP